MRSPQVTNRSINYLTTDGSHFVYRSRNGQFFALDIDKGKFVDLMTCKQSHLIEEICYSSGIFYIVWLDQQSVTPSSTSFFLESWILDQAQQKGLVPLKNCRLLVVKDLVAKHCLLVYTRGANVVLEAYDPQLKNPVKTMLAIEEETAEDDSHNLGRKDQLDLDSVVVQCSTIHKQIFSGDVSLIFISIATESASDLYYTAFFRGSLMLMAVFRDFMPIGKTSSGLPLTWCNNGDTLCALSPERFFKKLKAVVLK